MNEELENADAPSTPRKRSRVARRSPPPSPEPAEDASSEVPSSEGGTEQQETRAEAQGRSAASLRQPFVQRNFVAALLAGGILALFGVSSNPIATGIGLLGPIIVVVLFYLEGVRRDWTAYSDTRQRFADACYFLGFLFTMWALLIGFVPAGVGVHKLSSTEILRHFGMALGATAAGLICRILAIQTGGLEDDAAGVEADLHAFAGRITREAELIVEDLSRARARIVESQSIATAAMTERFEAALDGLVARLSDSVDGMAARIADGTDAAHASARHFAEIAAERTNALREVADADVAAHVELGAAAAIVAAEAAELGSALAQSRTSVVEALQASAAHLRTVDEHLRTALQIGSRTEERLTDVGARLDAAAEGVANLTETVEVQRTRLETRLELDRIAGDDMLERIDAGTSAFAERTEAANAEFARIVDGFTSRLSQLRRDGENQ